MTFWQKINALVPVKHIIFILCLFSLTIAIHQYDSAEDVKINVGETAVDIRTDRYTMNIPYDMIVELELTDIAEGGTKHSGSDNMVKRYGTWENDVWGTYCICADLDCTVCIVAHLNDGQTFVFSRKSNEDTAAIYDQLLTLLPNR